MAFIESDRGRIRLVHVQPQHGSICLTCGLLDPLQQGAAYALPAKLRRHFDGLNVAADLAERRLPLCDGETRHLLEILGNPGGRVERAHQPLQIAAPKPKRWMKTNFLDGIESRKIVRLVEAIVHHANPGKTKGCSLRAAFAI